MQVGGLVLAQRLPRLTLKKDACPLVREYCEGLIKKRYGFQNLRALGPGQARLTLASSGSSAQLCLGGTPITTVEVNVHPPVDVIFEAPTYIERGGWQCQSR